MFFQMWVEVIGSTSYTAEIMSTVMFFIGSPYMKGNHNPLA